MMAPAHPGLTADALADDTFDVTDESVSLESLADLSVWVAWRLDLVRDPKTGKETPRKVPYRPDGNGKARSNDPSTWGTRAEAQAGARRLLRGGAQGGVGIMLGTIPDRPGARLAGLDLDTCRDAATGTLTPWAARILRQFPTYAEVSPSRTGVKLFFTVREDAVPSLRAGLGKDSKGAQRLGAAWKRKGSEHPPGIELYLGGRWFAVTDDRLPDAPPGIEPVERSDLLRLIRTDGPAFAAEGKSTQAKATTVRAADQSRSGRALALAGKVRRRGGNRDAFESALADDAELAAWGADARQVARAWEASKGDGAADLEGFALNEDGVALAFAARLKDRLRYCHDAGQWYQFVGTYWRVERTRLAFTWARDTCRDMARAGILDPQSGSLAKAAAAAAVERYAQADRAFAVTSDTWDRDPWLLATPGGTVDLRTGELRPSRPGDFITRCAAVAPESNFDPDLDCPTWLAFLDSATGQDAALIRFLQQWCGYSLTGETREHALLFIYGPGGNGKSVFLNTVSAILGDFATSAAMDTFTEAGAGRHLTFLAMLKGARMVTASETEEGKAWAEVRIKQLTGGDPVTANYMRRDPFTFQPQFKLMLVGNNKPALNRVDAAARRRINVVPFDHIPPNPDRELESKLRAEFPGILAWMIRGCLDWQTNGLVRPAVVADATADYFAEQDTLQ